MNRYNFIVLKIVSVSKKKYHEKNKFFNNFDSIANIHVTQCLDANKK